MFFAVHGMKELRTGQVLNLSHLNAGDMLLALSHFSSEIGAEDIDIQYPCFHVICSFIPSFLPRVSVSFPDHFHSSCGACSCDSVSFPDHLHSSCWSLTAWSGIAIPTCRCRVDKWRSGTFPDNWSLGDVLGVLNVTRWQLQSIAISHLHSSTWCLDTCMSLHVTEFYPLCTVCMWSGKACCNCCYVVCFSLLQPWAAMLMATWYLHSNGGKPHVYVW